MEKKLSKQRSERRSAFAEAAVEVRQDFRAPVSRHHGKAVREVFQIEVGRIRADEKQVRQQGKELDSTELKELAASIEEHGLIQFPEVRYVEAEDCYEIIAGERRFLACSQILKWDRIPVKVTNISDPLELWKRQYAENAQRLAVDPIDLANSLSSIMEDQGLNQEQLATMINKSTTYVQKAMSISSRLSTEAQDILSGTKSGESISTVYEVATVPEEEQAEIAQQIVDGNLKQRDVVQLTGAAKQRSKTGTRGRKRGKKRPFETTLKTTAGATITVKFRKAEVSDEEVVTALNEAIAKLATQSGSRKAA